MKNQTVQIHTIVVRPNQPVYLISDVHLGAVNSDTRLLREHLRQAEEEDAIILINGDLFDAIPPTDTRFESGIHGLTINDYIGNYFREAKSIFGQTMKQIYMIGIGNHESKLRQYYHVDLAMLFYEEIKRVNPYAFYGGYHGFIHFRVATDQSHKKQTRTNYYMYYHHGYGGSSKRTGPRSMLLDLSQVCRADLYWTGHKHTFQIMQETVYVPHTHHVEAQTIYLLSTGSYLRPYNDQHATDYAVQKGMLSYSAQPSLKLIFNPKPQVSVI